jgi:hypothetical protein
MKFWIFLALPNPFQFQNWTWRLISDSIHTATQNKCAKMSSNGTHSSNIFAVSCKTSHHMKYYTEISFSFTQIYIAVSLIWGQHASGTINSSSYSHNTEEYTCKTIHRFLLDNTWKREHTHVSTNIKFPTMSWLKIIFNTYILTSL